MDSDISDSDMAELESYIKYKKSEAEYRKNIELVRKLRGPPKAINDREGILKDLIGGGSLPKLANERQKNFGHIYLQN